MFETAIRISNSIIPLDHPLLLLLILPLLARPEWSTAHFLSASMAVVRHFDTRDGDVYGIDLSDFVFQDADGGYTVDQNVVDEMINQAIAQYQIDAAAEKARRVEELRAENEKSSDARFSRLCRGCRSADPRERVVLTHCGHAVCRQCSDADGRHSLIVCPVCEKYSVFLRLFEERTSGEEEETSDASPAPFSRACGVCYAPNPAARAVVKTCGHVACLACIKQLKDGKRVKCPFCRENSSIVILIEHLLNEEGVECGVWAMPDWAGQALLPADAAVPADADDDDDFTGYDDFWTSSSSSAIVDDTSGSYNTLPTRSPFSETRADPYWEQEETTESDEAHIPHTLTRFPTPAGVEGPSPVQLIPSESLEPAPTVIAQQITPPKGTPDIVATPVVAQKNAPEDSSMIVAQPVAAPENSHEPTEEVHQERADGGGQSIFCCFSRKFRGVCG